MKFRLARLLVVHARVVFSATLLVGIPAIGHAQSRPASGAELLQRHRCGACHVDMPQAPPPVPLTASDALAVFAVLRSGEPRARHPDFALTEGEALAVALGVGEGAERGNAAGELRRLRRRHPQATPELGRRFARGLNCGGCHAGLPSQPGAGPVLAAVVGGSRAAWLRAYIRAPYSLRPFGARPGSGARMPDFGLDESEADSILVYLRERAVRGGERPADRVPALLQPHAAATATALLDRLSCRGCHQLDGRGGRIGPALDDVLTRREPGYVAAMIRAPEHTLPGSAMPRIGDARVERVIALLANGPAPESAQRGGGTREPVYLSPLDHPLIDADPGAAPAGYRLWCAACHGPRGDGDGFNARYLGVRPAVHTSDSAMAARADDRLYDGIAAGGASLGRSPEMPAFGAALRDDEIRELVRYIRVLCACSGPAWSREVAR